jgi:hypothetical protein
MQNRFLASFLSAVVPWHQGIAEKKSSAEAKGFQYSAFTFGFGWHTAWPAEIVLQNVGETSLKGFLASKSEIGILRDLSLGIDILSGLFWVLNIFNHSQKYSICDVN